MAAGLGPPPAATALTLLLSIGVSAPGLLRGPPAARSAASLRAAALRAGEVHRLLTYIFLYEDLASLACGAVVVWYFAGGFERSVGTAKHCVLTAAFTVLAALLYLLLEAFVSRLSEVEEAKGFLPVAFATLAVSTARCRMKRSLLLGLRVPVVLVPWLLLCLVWFVPSSSLLSNLCGLLTGAAYGLGYCSCLDFPEPVASKLDQMLPFSLLRRIPGLRYIPGSSAERRAFQSCKLIPTPGTYPTQSYPCSSPPALPASQLQHPSAQRQGFQHNCAAGHGPALGQEAPQQAPAAGQGLAAATLGGTGASPGQCCQLPGSSAQQHLCPPQPHTPTGLGLLAGVQQVPGCPAATVASVPAEVTRVQVY
ncbi:rhomboid domain-containing protein 2 isoform X1 [Melanerpes formicivorus]|uniref:rhomboid domain-containing protein 2 isoform X1 n=1 Tax=Melanerpes formicivorus TaxID=211600 RepID=UPI00358FE74C